MSDKDLIFKTFSAAGINLARGKTTLLLSARFRSIFIAIKW
jgi:hypothetical protein